nr:A disintegrin and metalloproteinase with thrombospondin motifs 12-like [Anolis sagrei ordinatus]
MSCGLQRNWIANFAFWVHLLNIQALGNGRSPPAGRFAAFPDKRQDDFIKTLQDYEVVSPAKVNAYGHFLSYSLHHNASNVQRKRDFRRKDTKVYYRIKYKEKDLFLNLTFHQGLLSNNYILERRFGNYTNAKIVPCLEISCHLIGTISHPDSGNGKAAISTCSGLTGYFHLPDGDYFIEPVKNYRSEDGAHPHIIYRANTVQKAVRKRRDTWAEKKHACGVNVGQRWQVVRPAKVQAQAAAVSEILRPQCSLCLGAPLSFQWSLRWRWRGAIAVHWMSLRTANPCRATARWKGRERRGGRSSPTPPSASRQAQEAWKVQEDAGRKGAGWMNTPRRRGGNARPIERPRAPGSPSNGPLQEAAALSGAAARTAGQPPDSEGKEMEAATPQIPPAESGAAAGDRPHDRFQPCSIFGLWLGREDLQPVTGYFHLPDGDYFIEPVKNYRSEDGAHPHIIYRANTVQKAVRKRRDTWAEKKHACGVNETLNFFKQQELRREKWERNHLVTKAASRRSVSRERWVETLVVADSKMIEYHGSENVESYILTIINMVAGLFHDPSIGNAIHIVLVRLILLEEEEQGLKIVHHADKTLASFCKWQKSINPKTDNNPLHHDVAVLLTRKDICAGMNRPCETLGLSHLSGMCQPHRSCNINEDSGLPLAFTIAHELGHSFGIQHDGKENDCEPVGRRPYIMSRQLQYDPTPLTWSRCSKEYITRFLDRGWGFCLDDVPKKKDLKPPFIAPGVLYDVHHQCQLQYGPNATFCDQVDNICQTLWCFVKGSCRSKLDAAADGTRCGENKWCFTGECITVGKSPEAVHGGWGPWSPWSHCTRTCGAGVQTAERQCNNPEPQFGGKYCTGERKRYRMCNIKLCRKVTPNFRQMQCSEFDTVAYKNEFYQWIPVYNPANPCELQCRPANNHFSEKMLDAVIDGTPCFEGNNSRDVCINGMCKTVGCDYEIDSNATEDRCGVCQGDGSSCQTVKITFNQSEGLGYVDIGRIPKGARNIKVIEVAEAGNFLALRSENPEKYYLNGGFIIQWNGDYKVAGTIFQYGRKGDLENLTAPGPTNESVWLQLLFQENNPGIKYEYTLRKDWSSENEVEEPEYFWQYGSWTGCSVTCGRGFQRQTARCVKKGKGVVKTLFCDPETQPNGKQKKCIERDCPPRWWAGEWQKCSTTCGPTGEKKRTVLCVQAMGLDEQALPAEECQHLLKPKTRLSCNRDVLCPSDWTVSNWTECTVTCGGGVRTRHITCPKNNGEPCDILKKPHSKALCGLQQCPPTRRPLFPHFKVLNGKIIRRIGPNTKRGPVNDFPTQKPKPGISTTTIAISTSTHVTQPVTSIPTPFSLRTSSQQEDLEVTTTVKINSSNSSIHNYSYAFSDNSSLKNTTWKPLTDNSSVSESTDISTIKPCHFSVSGFINNSISTDPMSSTVISEYSTEVANPISTNTDGGAKDKVESEWTTQRSSVTITGQMSPTSPTVHLPDTSSQISVIPTEEVLLTTVGPKDLQINKPTAADAVTEQPAQLEDILRDENKTTSG